MEEFVTITSNGITMNIPVKEVSLYTRAGYKVVKAEEVEKEPVVSAKPEKPAKPEKQSEK